MKIINVEGQICLVSNQDFQQLNRHRWKLHPQGYAYRKTSRDGRTATLLMHREILNAPTGMEVDHLGLKLDNRRERLKLILPLAHRRKHAHALIAFQKAHQIYPDKKQCVVCGASFIVNPRKRKRNKCCSPKCAAVCRAYGRTKQAQSCRKSGRNSSKPAKKQ